MGGQMGNAKVKMLNLKIIKILLENNILLVKGAVPGHNNSYLKIQK
jgi:large subunit ribosomal protein L3